jgi:Uri superfamily endonuclease
MFLSFIILFRIEFFAFQEKRLLKGLSLLFFNRASRILGSLARIRFPIGKHLLETNARDLAMERGAYCLCIGIKSQIQVRVGALEWLHFPEGHYIYVGSAMNGLESRLRRHLNTSRGSYRAIHWHIDYLLREEEVSIESIHVKVSDMKAECGVADAVSKRGVPVKGFGCSDCSCSSHLFRVDGCEFLSGLGLTRREPSEYSV